FDGAGLTVLALLAGNLRLATFLLRQFDEDIAQRQVLGGTRRNIDRNSHRTAAQAESVRLEPVDLERGQVDGGEFVLRNPVFVSYLRPTQEDVQMQTLQPAGPL